MSLFQLNHRGHRLSKCAKEILRYLVERLWRSVKYEDLYLKVYETVAGVKAGIGAYFEYYNSKRRHQGLNRRTPDQVYQGGVVWPEAA